MSTSNNRTTASTWYLAISTLPRELGVITFSISLYILINNILVLITFRRMKNIQVQHYFMIGLALGDLLTIVGYGLSVYSITRGEVWLTETLCNILGVENIVVVTTTTWLHSAMCIEKCISILNPLKHKVLTAQTAVKTLVKGIITLCFVIPQALYFTFVFSDLIVISYRSYVGYCSFNMNINILLLVVIVVLAVPMAIQIITHVLILRVIFSLRGNSRSRALLTIKTIGWTLVFYWACWIPFVIDTIWTVIPNITEPPKEMEFVNATGIFLNSGMSCFIYNMCMQSFRKQFKSLFKPCCRVRQDYSQSRAIALTYSSNQTIFSSELTATSNGYTHKLWSKSTTCEMNVMSSNNGQNSQSGSHKKDFYDFTRF